MVRWSGSSSEAASIALDVSHGFQGLPCSAPPFYVLSALVWKEFLVSWSSLAMVYWATGVSFCRVHCLEMAFLVLRQCSQLLDTVIPTVSFPYLWIPNSGMPVTQNSLKCTEGKKKHFWSCHSWLSIYEDIWTLYRELPVRQSLPI